MSSPLQLTGKIVADDDLNRLRDQNLHLANQLADCRAEFARMKMERDAMFQAVGGLRKILAPLWGELENVPAGIDVVSTPATPNLRIESAKRRMPGKPAEFIDLLLEHGPMNVTNFVTLARCSKQTAYNTLSKLSQAGIIQNNGGRYSLKEL
jgi:hypothetical protein